MSLNQLKKYPELLELNHFNDSQRKESLRKIFERDIEYNPQFKFRTKQIRPIKKEGELPMQTLFRHLITRNDEDEKGNKLKSRSFEMTRSQRLHWIKYHIDESKKNNIDIFSYEDRVKGKNVIRTYIYDIEQEYVIILEPQRSELDYFLLTAYYLHEPGGKKQIENKRKKKLSIVY